MQRYQPPHARSRTNGPTASPGPSRSSGPAARPGQSSEEVTSGQASSPWRVDGTQAPGSRCDDGPSGQQRVPKSYAPQPSRKDWSRHPSSSRVGSSVLASPASDIRPMRARGTQTPSVESAKEDEAREMEMMQSVSRSGGDGADGDALKDWATQERYRAYIDERINAHYAAFKTPRHTPPAREAKDEQESLSSIVLLFRKLREGVIASGRIDRFAVEVFESSARNAILAGSRPQVVSAMSGLVPGLYQALDDRKGKGRAGSSPTHATALSAELTSLSLDVDKPDNRTEFASLLLLYQLVVLGPKDFWSILFELTAPSRKRLRRPFDREEDGPDQSSPARAPARPLTSPNAFIDLTKLHFATTAARAMAEPTFAPLTYFALLQAEGGGTTYERAILSWAEHTVRERAWEVLRKGYMSCGLQWANKLLGEQAAAGWIRDKGYKVDEGVVRLRP